MDQAGALGGGHALVVAGLRAHGGGHLHSALGGGGGETAHVSEDRTSGMIGCVEVVHSLYTW